ncbi:MAG: 30S ribosomal protein S17 [Deltaproteobacteria bacterium]|nr:30S ribosomal protein S17 [Deltaproteobacteria bacterium]
MNQRTNKKVREGRVTSNRMQKTVVVTIERNVLHTRYKKYLRRKTTVKAHDENNECQIGDRVLIVECRPLSRDKCWRVRRIIERNISGTTDVATDLGESGPSPAA